MQKIFYNAKVITMNDSAEVAEAFFVNDGSLVLVGSNKEVLEMKTDDTEVVDLKGKTVIPTFFNTHSNIFKHIDFKIKNAKSKQKNEKNEDLSEDFEKFCNFEKYLKEFLNIQKQLVKYGITTILEQDLNRDGFVFWKKVSESGKLKIDVIAYVDFVTSKAVMDNNCRSYRKYKEHFRLGGYSVVLDGNVIEKKACLKKPYKREKGYAGYPTIYDEQLAFLLKTSLEEKKQLVVFASGDKAIDSYIRCYSEFLEKEKPDDKYKPLVSGGILATEKQIKKLKEFDIALDFDISEIHEHSKDIKFNLGTKRLCHSCQTLIAKNENIDFMIHDDSKLVPNMFEIIDFVIKRNSIDGLSNKKQKIDLNSALSSLIKTSAKLCFDGEQKGSLESGKHASFLILSKDLTEDNLLDIKVEEVYLMSEKVDLSESKQSNKNKTSIKNQKTKTKKK